MCCHNKRLDESFCWRCCCSGKSSEIDYDNIKITKSNNIEIKSNGYNPILGGYQPQNNKQLKIKPPKGGTGEK